MAYLLVLILSIVVDYLYVRWAQASTTNRAMQAGVTSGLIQLSGATATILYVANPWLLIPTIVGHSAGSYFAVKFTRRDNAKD